VSIVERAAARLGVVPDSAERRPNPTPQVVGGRSLDGEALEQPPSNGSLQRAVERAGSEADAPLARVPSASAEPSGLASDPVPVAPKNPRVLKIDFSWLAQRNFITPGAARKPIEDGFRRIKRQVLANVKNPVALPADDSPVNLVMVTSALPAEGKTFCAINLAISIALELDYSVLLVDADVVRPSVLPALGLKNGLPGLMDVLADRQIQVGDVLHRTNVEKLSILPAGTAHRYSTEMLASEAMQGVVRELAERYNDRIVIFDSPPLLVTSEASVLASLMSQVVLVVAAEQTTEAALGNALRRLEGCKQVGLLLNKGRDTGSRYGAYGYGYG
jgi:protein-tyrosine kinase